MEAFYNYTELISCCKDREFIVGFVNQLVSEKFTLEVEYLDKHSFTPELYAELQNLLDQTMEATYLIQLCIKDMNLEKAASFRDKQHELIKQMEILGFRSYKIRQDEFTVYHVNVDEKERILKYTIYTNSLECIELMEETQERIERRE